jgi:tRNA-specific 2-thiouridylase
LWVVQGHDHPWLQSMALDAQDASWVAGHAPMNGVVAAKTRYRQADATCSVGSAGGLGGLNDSAFSLRFDQPQWAVTPGQSAVVYDGEVCLGGGVIASVMPN